MLTCTTCSPEETRALGAEVGARISSGDVILLRAGLGAGKTTFVQGIAHGLGVAEPVTSPTFTLIREYTCGRLPLFHIDPYRLSDASDLSEIGLDEYLERHGAVVVEWAERLGDLTPNVHLLVRIVAGDGDCRRIDLIPRGTRWESLVREIGGLRC